MEHPQRGAARFTMPVARLAECFEIMVVQQRDLHGIVDTLTVPAKTTLPCSSV
jgi:hypothetical protein